MPKESKTRAESSRKMLRGKFESDSTYSSILDAKRVADRHNAQDQKWKEDALKGFDDTSKD